MTEPASIWALRTLGVRFGDEALLIRALTHKSVGPDNYERIEFLGDRLLGAAMAAWLFELFPAESEGQLTRRIAKLVSRESCAEIARTLGVAQHVRLGPQARSDGGADSDNILGDVLEALIGAAFLEGGMDAVTALVRRVWGTEVASVVDAPKHPKSAVQEWAAAKALKGPVYRLLARTGPHHNPRFRVELAVAHLPPVEAEGASKQEAETSAAVVFLATHDG